MAHNELHHLDLQLFTLWRYSLDLTFFEVADENFVVSFLVVKELNETKLENLKARARNETTLKSNSSKWKHKTGICSVRFGI